MENMFLRLAREGRIRDLDGLKSVYRKLVKKTHPDSVRSDRFVARFVKIREQYEEALRNFTASFHAGDPGTGARYGFFRLMSVLDGLELPHNKSRETREEIPRVLTEIDEAFQAWSPAAYPMFSEAMESYSAIKKEKQPNTISQLRKPTLAGMLKPVMFNIIYFHLTGSEVYPRQLKRKLGMILDRLESEGYDALKRFLLWLVEDMEKGPALLD